MFMRRFTILLVVASIVAALVIPAATASQYRGRYQVRLDQPTTLLAPAAPTR
jgi:hypothetical protein